MSSNPCNHNHGFHDLQGLTPLYHKLGLRVAAWPNGPQSVFAVMGCGLG